MGIIFALFSGNKALRKILWEENLSRIKLVRIDLLLCEKK